jgi:hypothetical protein
MTQTTQGTSKIEARRRAREATRRANEARIARERDNIEDAATCMVAIGKVGEIDAWESERLAALRDQVRTEASKRRGEYRGEASAALARMQGRGESLTTIAALTGVGVAEVRALLRHTPGVRTSPAAKAPAKAAPGAPATAVAPKGAADNGAAGGGSGALGGEGDGERAVAAVAAAESGSESPIV